LPGEATYPLLKRRVRRPWRTRIGVRPRVIAVAVLAAALIAGVAALALRSPAPDLHAAARALAAGDYSTARDGAAAVLRDEPGSATAALVLARADLALGDGRGAGDALARAVANGVAPGRVRAMKADALLLGGDPEAALAAAGRDGSVAAARVRARVLAAKGDPRAAQMALEAIVQRAPGEAGAWTDLGRIRLTAGDVGGASEAAATAARVAPGEPAALTLQGEVVRARYGLAASLPWFRAALARDPRYPPALAEAAATLGDLGRSAEMLGMTRRLLASRPGDARALYLQAVLALRADKPELARDLLQAGGLWAGVPGAQLIDGAADYRSGRFEQAAIKWRRLADDQPLNVTVRRLLAAALLRSGDPAGALDAIRPVAVRGDADPYALDLTAAGLAATGNARAAAGWQDRAGMPGEGVAAFATDRPLASLRAEAAGAPTDPSYQLGVIRGLIGGGDGAGALAAARALAGQSPGSPAAQGALGDALALAGRSGEVVGAYARGAALRFDEPAMLRLVEALGRAGRRDDAARTLALYLAQSPRSVSARRLLGRWQVEGGLFDQAAATLEGVRRSVGSRDAGLLTDLALAHAGAGDDEAAVACARAAYRLQPMSARVADAYAVALAAAGDGDGARQLADKAVALAPRDPVILEHRRQIG